MFKNSNKSKISTEPLKNQNEELKESVDLLYQALSSFIREEIIKTLKEFDIIQLISGEVKGKNKTNTKVSVDIGDTIVRNVLNKSDKILKLGDSVTLLNRFGGNYRNSFVICQNGEEKPLEMDLEDAVENIEDKIDALHTTSTTT